MTWMLSHHLGCLCRWRVGGRSKNDSQGEDSGWRPDVITLMSKLDRRLLAIEIKVFKLQISILGIYLLLLTQDLKLLWFCFVFFFTGSVTYVVIGTLLAVLVVIVLFVWKLYCRRRCKTSKLVQGTPETSSVAGSVATNDSGNLSNDIIIGW